jgi:hypothetical protein
LYDLERGFVAVEGEDGDDEGEDACKDAVVANADEGGAAEGKAGQEQARTDTPVAAAASVSSLAEVYETEQDNMTLREIAEGTGVAEETLIALNIANHPGITALAKLRTMTTIVVKVSAGAGVGPDLSEAVEAPDTLMTDVGDAVSVDVNRSWGWGVGDRVEVDWAAQGIYYGGVIRRIKRLQADCNGSGGGDGGCDGDSSGECVFVYDIRYDDGDAEADVPSGRVRAPVKPVATGGGGGDISNAKRSGGVDTATRVRVRWLPTAPSIGRAKPFEVRGLFRASVWHHGLPHDLGLWPDVCSASRAYDFAAHRLGSCKASCTNIDTRGAGLECYISPRKVPPRQHSKPSTCQF